jgi:endonuclease IV
MRQITLNIPENMYSFFNELIQKLGLEKINEVDANSEEEILAGIERGLKEVKEIEEGKIKGKPLREFLNEL